MNICKKDFRSAYLALLSVLFLSGCATYNQGISDSRDLAKQGQWHEAEEIISETLDSSQDHLLRLLEKGALAQYQGDYERSNQLLEQAERLSDTFLEESISSRSWALLANPMQGDFQPTGFERVYINFFKSLNYLALAEQAKSRQERQSLLDAALVESRRIDLKLNEIAALNPSYEDIDGANKAFLSKAVDWLSGFYTGGINSDDYVYRDDAWARYMEGLQYEISGEYDDARIAYQASANLYDKGYTKQYNLPKDAGQRAWLDTIRMMKKAGGWQSEYPSLAKEKLNKKYQALLADYDKKPAEIIVLEEQGFVPERKELNLMLYASPQSYSLVLEPLYTGTHQDANNASRWFSMVYADQGLLNLFANYQAGGAWNTFAGVFTKRIILGNAGWRSLRSVGIDKMLSEAPVRIAVPYYDPVVLDSTKTKLSSSLATSGASKHDSVRMTSLADITMQVQLSQASRDIYETLLRELLRNYLAYKVSSEVQDETASLLLGFVGKIAVLASASSETRNWSTLPAQIRLTRQAADTGLQSLNYQTNGRNFTLDPFELNKNQIKVWNIRNPN
ncbi:hypothetical protein OA92_10745 [Marinomonas sp. SBI22]|uniref:hypothetical protein n=1 Tax=unclassified Marinomonas TaxID=196814 RepID=UPI0005FA5CB1|nr:MULTISPECIES: hypothetical protein [unclassified Marinomonas]KJZ15877.1 hypothetical protein TW85_03045 [Marinomonas sp. S3726]KZM43203.1 hypothetical protein OA92_10745 [Marinomonas sp. SBI22]KZM44773.1 hypothetical protein OA91_10170 [Marinomonas sp. SBI8L]